MPQAMPIHPAEAGCIDGWDIVPDIKVSWIDRGSSYLGWKDPWAALSRLCDAFGFCHGLHASQNAFRFFVQAHILDLTSLCGGKCEHAMVNVEIGPPGRKLFRLAQACEDGEPRPRSIGRPELLQES